MVAARVGGGRAGRAAGLTACAAKSRPGSLSPGIEVGIFVTSMPGERAERTSEQALVDALDRISDGIIVYDQRWRIAYINRSAERYFERTREELLGLGLLEAFPDAAGTEVERELRRAAAGEAPHEFSLFAPVRHRWVAFRAYPSDAGLTVYFRDVTEQKRAEDELREREARHRALFEQSLGALLLTAPNGGIFAANPAACRMFEMTEEEICRGGRALLVDMTDPRSRAFLEARRRDGHAHGELTCLRKGGRPFSAEVSSAIFRDVTGVECTSMQINDLTRRKRAEEAIRLLADAGRLLVTSLDPETMSGDLARLLVPHFADACVVDLLPGIGAGHRPRAGGARADVRQLLDREPWSRVLRRVLASRKAERIEVTAADWLGVASLAREGLGAAPCSLLFVPLVARDRAIGELVLLRRSGRDAFDDADVTLGEGLADRAAAAIDNARLYAASLEATRLRDDVLGVVSHDLRGPLNGISLTARLIARRHPDEPGPRAILDAVALANQLLGDLLLAGKLESGTFAVHPQPESVREIVDEVLALARPEAGDRAIELWTSVDADVAEAWVDRLRMLQLVGNLVSNALKFTPRGGRVGIRVRRAGEQVEVAVSDTGPGIPPDQIPHLFDRFWQGAQARSADAGLGLSIAKGIAEAHGGDIRVESELGHGATFIVTLPLQGQTADSNAVAS